MKEKIIEILNEYAKKEFDSFGNPCISKSDFPAIAEKICELDNWVSVEIPPDLGEDGRSEKVLIRYDDGDIIVAYLSGKIWNTSLGFIASAPGFKITHWQPLPKPKTI